MEWLPALSTTVDPALSDIARWAGGGIIRSSVVTRYQLGFVRQAGSVIEPLRASTPHGTCESAMNAACSAGTSPANEAWNFARSRKRKPSLGGRIGGGGGARRRAAGRRVCRPPPGRPHTAQLNRSAPAGAFAGPAV